MSVKHPVLNSITAVLTDIAVFGFSIFFILRPCILGLNFVMLAAGLFLLQLFDSLILKNPLSVGRYICLNTVPSALLCIAAIRLPLLKSPDLFTYLWYYLAFLVLLVHRIYRACIPASQSSRILSTDGLIVIIIIVKIWHYFDPGAGILSLMKAVSAALVVSLLNLAVSRLALPSFERGRVSAASVFFPAAFIIFFGGVGAAVSLWGENVSSGLVSFIISIVRLILSGLAFLWSCFAAFCGWLFSLFPDTPPGEADPFILPSVQTVMEQENRTPNTQALFFLLIVCAAAVISYLLYKVFSKNILGIKTGGKSTAKNERRTSHLMSFIKKLCSELTRFFRMLWILFVHPNSMPALIFRAGWYGKRHLHPRKTGETLREYLCRLDRLHEIGSAASLLSAYADRYLYSAEKLHMSKNDIRQIKKAFSFF